jgi:opacity protein-like surface antigen
MKAIVLIALLASAVCLPAQARDVNVNGYFRSNGTYVQPYVRTSPDNSVYNNYSTPSNFNPGYQPILTPNVNFQHNFSNPAPVYQPMNVWGD